MAEARERTVLLSIHQPGARIVKMFDSVLLLAAGSVLHHGTVDQLRALLSLVWKSSDANKEVRRGGHEQGQRGSGRTQGRQRKPPWAS
jgi:ABC-type multidrug transport system ATPase subunit